jgi:hypothetical protein
VNGKGGERTSNDDDEDDFSASDGDDGTRKNE